MVVVAPPLHTQIGSLSCPRMRQIKQEGRVNEGSPCFSLGAACCAGALDIDVSARCAGALSELARWRACTCTEPVLALGQPGSAEGRSHGLAAPLSDSVVTYETELSTGDAVDGQ